MPRDEHYFTEAEAQSKLRKRVRVKQSSSGYTAGQMGIVHETGSDREAKGYYVAVYWENGDSTTQYNRTGYEDSVEELVERQSDVPQPFHQVDAVQGFS